MGSEPFKRPEITADDSKAKTGWIRWGSAISCDHIQANGKEFDQTCLKILYISSATG